MIEDYPYAKFGAQRILDRLEGINSPKRKIKVKKEQRKNKEGKKMKPVNDDSQYYPS